MNLISKTLAVGVLSALSLNASAAIIETVQLNFASGGVFNGTITFNDGYEGMIDTQGTLTGGSNSYNEVLSWTWWQGNAAVNPQASQVSPPYYNDWLMNGTSPSDYDLYIGLAWDAAAAVLSGGISFYNTGDSYTYGVEGFDEDIADLITSFTIGDKDPVDTPEPSELAILGLGLGALMAAKRRKQASRAA